MASQDGAVSIATAYGLDGRGVGIRVPLGARFFLHIVQTGSEAHPTFCQRVSGKYFSGIKWPRYEDDHSPPTSAEVKNMWIHTFATPYVFHGVVLS
jgi:hypothetical protein